MAKQKKAIPGGKMRANTKSSPTDIKGKTGEAGGKSDHPHHVFLRKIYSICGIILGILILSFYGGLISISEHIANGVPVFAMIVMLYGIYSTIDALLDLQIQVFWKLYGLISNILVLGAGFLVVAKHYPFLMPDIVTSQMVFVILGVVIVIDNIFWLMVGE